MRALATVVFALFLGLPALVEAQQAKACVIGTPLAIGPNLPMPAEAFRFSAQGGLVMMSQRVAARSNETEWKLCVLPAGTPSYVGTDGLARPVECNQPYIPVGWSTPIHPAFRGLVGPEGPRGPQGLTGPTGSQGPQGLQGLQGLTPALDPSAFQARGSRCGGWCKAAWTTGGIALGSLATYLIMRGDDDPAAPPQGPGVVTGSGKPICTGVGCTPP